MIKITKKKELKLIEEVIDSETNKNKNKKGVKRIKKITLSQVFKKKKRKFGLGHKTEEPDIEQNLLFLITNDGKCKIYEGVDPGYVEMTRSDGEDTTIILDSGKLLDIEYNGQSVRGWIHYEDEASSYPTQTEFDSAIFRKLISKMILNVENYKAKKIDAWGSTIFKVLLGIGIIAVAIGLYVLPNLDKLASTVATNPKEIVETAQVINATANETIRHLSKTVLP